VIRTSLASLVAFLRRRLSRGLDELGLDELLLLKTLPGFQVLGRWQIFGTHESSRSTNSACAIRNDYSFSITALATHFTLPAAVLFLIGARQDMIPAHGDAPIKPERARRKWGEPVFAHQAEVSQFKTDARDDRAAESAHH
jgi:hypothetical protein